MLNVIGKMPEFTTDDATVAPVAPGEEVKQTPAETPETETETPKTELPAEEEKPLEPKLKEDVKDPLQLEKETLQRSILGLRAEKENLLKEITETRGKRREIKQEELLKVEEKLDELADVNPSDVELIEKVMRKKGYMKKEEAESMFYKSVEQEEIQRFLEKYPEYKAENDPNDIHWGAFKRELGYYVKPKDPHRLAEFFERAHRGIIGQVAPTNLQAKKRQLEVAGVGGGGAQRSVSLKTLDPQRRAMLEHGGWSKEEIDRIEKGLTE